jgi:hypothetical protein
MTNLAGQVVVEMNVEKTSGELIFDLPLNDVQRGIYQVSVSDGEKMVVDRLVRL